MQLASMIPSSVRPVPPSVFARPAGALATALRTAAAAAPSTGASIGASLFSTPPARPSLVSASSAIRNFVPAAVGTTSLPIGSQAPPAAGVQGMFATLARFSAPASPPRALTAAPTNINPTGLFATPVGSSPGNFIGRQLFRGTAAVQPFNMPPAPSAVQPVTTATYTNAGPMPPATPATTPTGQTPQGSSTALPAAGGGFDPGSVMGSGDGPYLNAGQPDPFNPGYDMNGQPLPAAPAAASSISFGQIALYGGVGLAGLWILSKVFGGKASAA